MQGIEKKTFWTFHGGVPVEEVSKMAVLNGFYSWLVVFLQEISVKHKFGRGSKIFEASKWNYQRFWYLGIL